MPVIVCVPALPAPGVYETEQLAVPVVPVGARLQLVGLKVPTAFEVKLTLPVGVTAPVPELSVTVAVHCVAWLTVTDESEQFTVVVVDLIVDVTVKAALVLPVWTVSPTNEPVMP